MNLLPISLVPPLVIPNHISAHQRSHTRSRCSKRSHSDQSRLILWRILRSEEITGHKTHQVRQRDTHRRKRHTTTFVSYIVVVPCRKQDGRRRSSPAHHESSKVSDVDLLGHIIERSVDDKPDESERVAHDDERESNLGEIRSEGEDQKHDCASNVWSNGVQVRFDRVEAKRGYDLGKEERHALERHAKADFDQQESVGRWEGEDLQGILEVELFSDGRRGIDLDTMERKRFVVVVEERG